MTTTEEEFLEKLLHFQSDKEVSIAVEFMVKHLVNEASIETMRMTLELVEEDSFRLQILKNLLTIRKTPLSLESIERLLSIFHRKEEANSLLSVHQTHCEG